MNIFIHRRDFRLNDNTTLNILKEKDIVPVFIFTPEQIKNNEYFSDNLVQFMCQSLEELDKEYQKKKSSLNLFFGDVIDVLEEIHKKYTLNSVSFNEDYSPYASERDTKIKDFCQHHKIKVYSFEDMLLVPIKGEKTYPNKEPYQMFTPFMRYLKSNYSISKPKTLKKIFSSSQLSTKYSITFEETKKYYKKNKDLNVPPGRKKGLQYLKKVNQQKDYSQKRDTMTYETTYLSAYLNLGLVSIREVYHKIIKELGIENGLVTELYWRDFYYNIMFFNPHVVGGAFRKQYNKIKWNNSKKDFEKWCTGQTGFPIVDAAMRQLNSTGYMHNRGRMLVASFLVKDLWIDWRWGEKYFAQHLEDYNISANNGGWQWAASTGTDSQPYFRIFSPWSQSEKYDNDCQYIKKWIPELKDVPTKDIHNWFKTYSKHKVNYPHPMVDHKEQAKKAIAYFKSLK